MPFKALPNKSQSSPFKQSLGDASADFRIGQLQRRQEGLIHLVGRNLCD
jgi:hypothetical protein